VHEVYRKQAGRIEELERENRRLEKEVEEVTGRFKKTEDQLEDLREASVDVAELRERLRVAEGKVERVEELVCFTFYLFFCDTDLSAMMG
jgi:archaellum component FlaC